MKYLRCLFISFLVFYMIGCTYAPKELTHAEQLMDTAPESALQVLKQIQQNRLFTPSNKALYALLMSQALDKNDIKVESDSLIHIATDYYSDSDLQRAAYAWFYSARVANNKGEAKTQADALLKAQEYAEKTDNSKLKALVYADKGQMYFLQKQYKNSIYHYKSAQINFKLINDNSNEILSLLNIGYGYLYMSLNDSAMYYYKLAEKQALHTNDTTLLSVTLRNLGTFYLQQKKYPQALFYYQKVPTTKLNKYNSNKWYLIANTFLKMNLLDSAKLYLSEVDEFNEMAPNYYGLWQQIYEKEGKLSQALLYASKATNAIDSLYKTKLEVSFAGLEKKYKYQGLQLSKQQLEIKNKKYGIVLLIVLLILSIFTVVFLFWRIRVKKQQLETQKQLILHEHDLLQRQIENNALLEKQLKIRAILLMNIEKHRRDAIKNSKLWKDSSQESNLGHKDTFYQELIASMDLEYNNISSRLLIEFPTLSSRDIQVCCLLLANFDTGMIAIILDLKIESMNTYRYRLRTKFGLTNPDNLMDYLRNF